MSGLFIIVPIFIMVVFALVFTKVFRSFMGPNNISGLIDRAMRQLDQGLQQKVRDPAKKERINLNCRNCGAENNKAVDISPSGDMKCLHCDTWFNILT